MNQTTFPFVSGLSADPPTDSYAERQVTNALVRAGYIFHPKPANDNDPCRAIAYHHSFPNVAVRLQSDLRPALGIELTADLHWTYYAWEPRNLVVEIDGDEWHSSTQRIHRDKRLDRLVQQAPGSWSIFRYPAKEVLDRRLADHVIEQIHRYVRGWLDPSRRRTSASSLAL